VAIQRQLANPPIKEALLDFRLAVAQPPEFTEALSKASIPGLEKKQVLTTGQFEIKIGPVSEAMVKQQERVGWRYESEDGSRVVQMRRDGITYSILRGYKDFPEIKDAARKIWQLYLEHVQASVTVARTAARYINVLDVPGNVEMNDYLTSAPQIPKELPQVYENFLQRVAIPYQRDTHAIITQALEPSVQPGARVILDIDVFALRAISGESLNLWSLVDELRVMKNTIFFSSVTELALEQYA
jgi:uncharacterized protein (TIGR04255 family)